IDQKSRLLTNQNIHLISLCTSNYGWKSKYILRSCIPLYDTRHVSIPSASSIKSSTNSVTTTTAITTYATATTTATVASTTTSTTANITSSNTTFSKLNPTKFTSFSVIWSVFQFSKFSTSTPISRSATTTTTTATATAT